MVRKTCATPSGRIAFSESGQGPVALFVHGVLLNSHLWRHQLSGLSDIRRCIAVDLLAHGDTEIAPAQDVSVTANAKMLVQFLDALGIDTVDLVGNDSGGGIAQIFAAENPSRVRTLTLTDCDAHDNWPPDAFKPFLDMAAAGGLRDTLEAMLASKPVITCTDSGGPLEFVINHETGVVAEPTPESLATAFDSLWENRKQAKTLGEAGRARYESLNLSWETVVNKLLA